MYITIQIWKHSLLWCCIMCSMQHHTFIILFRWKVESLKSLMYNFVHTICTDIFSWEKISYVYACKLVRMLGKKHRVQSTFTIKFVILSRISFGIVAWHSWKTNFAPEIMEMAGTLVASRLPETSRELWISKHTSSQPCLYYDRFKSGHWLAYSHSTKTRRSCTFHVWT